jgi:(E)-4-hydroxy-3-methylbut-2-enyl-diphosphate synthase
LFRIVEEVESALLREEEPYKIAIMGCVVNGPGEAREADVGVAGGDGKGVLFRKGKVIRSIPQDRLAAVLLEEVRKLKKREAGPPGDSGSEGETDERR